MLDIAFIRQNPDVVRAAITNKRLTLDLDELLAADKERRETIAKLEQRRARKNEIAAAIPKASKEERPKLIEEGKAVKTGHGKAGKAAHKFPSGIPKYD